MRNIPKSRNLFVFIEKHWFVQLSYFVSHMCHRLGYKATSSGIPQNTVSLSSNIIFIYSISSEDILFENLRRPYTSWPFKDKIDWNQEMNRVNKNQVIKLESLYSRNFYTPIKSWSFEKEILKVNDDICNILHLFTDNVVSLELIDWQVFCTFYESYPLMCNVYISYK